jgi:hypothetical protein
LAFVENIKVALISMTTIIYGIYQFVMVIQGILQEPLHVYPPLPQPNHPIPAQPPVLHPAPAIEQPQPASVQLRKSNKTNTNHSV